MGDFLSIAVDRTEWMSATCHTDRALCLARLRVVTVFVQLRQHASVQRLIWLLLLHDLVVDISAEFASPILEQVFELGTEGRPLINTHDELSWKKHLHLQALIDQVVLGHHVQSLEVLVLLKLL